MKMLVNIFHDISICQLYSNQLEVQSIKALPRNELKHFYWACFDKGDLKCMLLS